MHMSRKEEKRIKREDEWDGRRGMAEEWKGTEVEKD